MIKKIISGGQTGADQAALDVAIKLGISHGGWIPKGRMTENGSLPDKYHLKEMPTKSYAERTEKNILDSDGTLILSHGEITGGSSLTLKLAKEHNKPWLHIDFSQTIEFKAAQIINDWVIRHNIEALNVAGPRASKDPNIYKAAMDVLEAAVYLGNMEESTVELEKLSEEGLPRTVEEAVERLIAEIPLKDKVHIAHMKEEELELLYFSTGLYIINTFKISNGNSELLNSCRKLAGNDSLHEDSATALIIKELWKRLRETHRLKVIK